MQGYGDVSTATYKSRAVGNLKVPYSILTAPLHKSEYLHEKKLSPETVCVDFALKLHFSAETIISPLF